MFKFKNLLLSTAFVIAGTAAITPAIAANIYDTLKANPQFSILVQSIDANGVKYQYTANSPRTVFAPTNDAFNKIKGGYQDMITPSNPNDKENVQALLLYQIVPGRHTPESLRGKTIHVKTLQNGEVRIDGATDPKQIIYGDEHGTVQSGPAINASNGVIIPVGMIPTPVFSEVNEDNTPVPAPHEGLTPPPPAQPTAPTSGSSY